MNTVTTWPATAGFSALINRAVPAITTIASPVAGFLNAAELEGQRDGIRLEYAARKIRAKHRSGFGDASLADAGRQALSRQNGPPTEQKKDGGEPRSDSL